MDLLGADAMQGCGGVFEGGQKGETAELRVCHISGGHIEICCTCSCTACCCCRKAGKLYKNPDSDSQHSLTPPPPNTHSLFSPASEALLSADNDTNPHYVLPPFPPPPSTNSPSSSDAPSPPPLPCAPHSSPLSQPPPLPLLTCQRGPALCRQ
jgi:hypothetical protein